MVVAVAVIAAAFSFVCLVWFGSFCFVVVSALLYGHMATFCSRGSFHATEQLSFLGDDTCA
jgi:hypothetical protein